MATARRRELIVAVGNLPFFTAAGRARFLRRAGVVAADGVEINSGIRISGHAQLHLGRNNFVNFDGYFDCEAPIAVGDYSGFAVGVRIITTHHDILNAAESATATTITAGDVTPKPVRIGTHVWVGAGAILLPGVTIGDNCVIGAGAVVTRDCEPGGIYAGVPARRIGSVPGWETR